MSYDIGWNRGLTDGRRAMLEGPAAFAALQQNAADAVAMGGESAKGFSHGVAAGGAEAMEVAEAVDALAAKSLMAARQVARQRYRALQHAVAKWGGSAEPSTAARQAHDAAVLVAAMLDRRAAPVVIAAAESAYTVAAKLADSLALERSI